MRRQQEQEELDGPISCFQLMGLGATIISWPDPLEIGELRMRTTLGQAFGTWLPSITPAGAGLTFPSANERDRRVLLTKDTLQSWERAKGVLPHGEMRWGGGTQGPESEAMRMKRDRLEGWERASQSQTHSGCDCLSSDVLSPGLGSQHLQETHNVTQGAQCCILPYQHPRLVG